eukprot:2315726-Ditylum_brightwellii.AAC.2
MATDRFFIRLPKIYKQYFHTMSEYFGRPLRLRKAIYSLTVSGKLWDNAHWFLQIRIYQHKDGYNKTNMISFKS